MPMRYHYHHISRKDLRELVKISREVFKCSVEEPEEGIVVYGENAKIYIADKTPLVIELEGKERIPAIHLLNKNLCPVPYVVIDQGAVPRILNGADVMAPGIIETSEFKQGDLVGVREPQKRAFIAVGRALMSSQEVTSIRKGKAVKNIHHVGDKIWDIVIEVLMRL
ncbi:MAG: PUA domain-containing protein [Sulfolobales archaeon]